MTPARYITGYSDPMSVTPGRTVRFYVSAEGVDRYRADIVRLIHGDLNPAGPGFKEKPVRTSVSATYRARRQKTYPGSCVVIAPAPLLDALASFTLQAFIWPTTPTKGRQIVLGRWADRRRAGYALILDEAGAAALLVGDGRRVEVLGAGLALREREWAFVAATYNAKTGEARVVQETLGDHAALDTRAEARRELRVKPRMVNRAPLAMAAGFSHRDGERSVFRHHYNGKIDRPRLANRVLDATAMIALRAHRPGDRDRAGAVVGWWDLAEGMATTAITDLSINRLHGETVHLPTRAMTGHNWSGRTLRAHDAREEYGAIHFHDDDLYDSGWDVAFELDVPRRLKSGVYAARLRATGEAGGAGEVEDYIPFFVRPAPSKPTARIAYLAETATYMAYANFNVLHAPESEPWASRLLVIYPDNLLAYRHGEWGKSLYETHSDGSGISFSSRLRPITNMRPKHNSPFGLHGSSLREFCADTHLTGWLEAEGHGYDVITDEDLDAEGLELLRPYDVVLTGTHPEYTSTRMWDALKAYTDQGGRLMYMGGNGFYWRIAYHPECPGALEMRRAGGSRTWITEPGEEYQSIDGERAGLWRDAGRAPQRLVGSGMVAMGFDIASYFKRRPESHDPRVAFAFEGIGDDEPIGAFGLIGGGAAGLEFDRAEPRYGTPPHALIVARSENHTESYLLVVEEMGAMIPNIHAPENPLIHADMVFYETANGGAVFSFSSQCWCGSLSHNGYDNNVSRLTGNVLNRFLDPTPL